MKIKRTGIENYLPDGEQNLKLMVIGGPGVGKTRFSGGWPKPFYLNCEAGLSSVADLNVPYTDIESSADMLQALKWLKRHPDATSNIGTVIVDTLDAFQRKVKQEWLDQNANAESFSGYDAWGYLDSKMQMLMTRLLSLPYNVVVLVHYKDKTYTEKVGGSNVERHEFILQLQGDIKDTAFNDFDLVGWMDTFWKPGGEGGGKIEARGITFKSTPDKPFLKDRLHITGEWYEISLEADELEGNYLRLFEKFISRLDDLNEGGEDGEIPDLPDEQAPAGEGVVPPGPGGPVPPQDPKGMDLDNLTKTELIKMAKDIPAIADEVKTSLLKAEVIELIEKARREEKQDAETQAEQAAADNAEKPAEPAQEAPSEPEPADEPEPETVDENHEAGCQKPPGHEAPCGPVDASDASDEETPEEPSSEAAEPSTDVEEEAPQDVAADDSEDTTSGEAEQASEEVASTPEPAEQQEKAQAEHVCEECGKDLAGENQDYVKLAWIKFRTKLCNEHYIQRKKG